MLLTVSIDVPLSHSCGVLLTGSIHELLS